MPQTQPVWIVGIEDDLSLGPAIIGYSVDAVLIIAGRGPLCCSIDA